MKIRNYLYEFPIIKKIGWEEITSCKPSQEKKQGDKIIIIWI